MAMHLALIFFLDNQIARARGMESRKTSSVNFTTIHLSTSKIPVLTSEIAPTSTNIQTQKIAQTSIRRITDTESARELAPPIIDILIPPEPYYFPEIDLTEKPLVLRDVPTNLAAMLTSPASHSAIFRLQINEQGEIDHVIVDTSEFSESEEKILVETFSKLKFEPGKINEMPVKSELRIQIRLDVDPPIRP